MNLKIKLFDRINLSGFGGLSSKFGSKAINSTWKEASASTTSNTVMIAKGNYLVGPVKFQGPCKAPVSVRVEGALQALVEPEKLKLEDGWVIFQNIDGVTVSGDGTFDGQGSIAKMQLTAYSKFFKFEVDLQHVIITTPGESLTTDGIHIPVDVYFRTPEKEYPKITN
ncbi:hypothetical protein PRUPE_3G203700 [Prunus persica]|uniref:Pectate lyase superfamily protein domain-containing protein n=1 Tax=Prunus persica TaxID=3760 RepID=A0A251Q370_PRUPE|nr:hypothetical protein PRUPE_3G203700 [Prunus persica]